MKWEETNFSDLVDINPKVFLQKGEVYDFIPMDVVDGNYKFVREKIKKQYNGGGAKFINGDTIFARITPCLENGKISKVKNLDNDVGFGSTEFFVFRAKNEISEEDFIYYLSKTDIIRQPSIKSMVGASGRQRADKGVIENIKVPRIPLSIQRKIASILSAYDDLIENNLKRIKLLEESAEFFYKIYFDFFNPSIKNNNLPKGWFVKLADEIFDIKIGKTPPREQNQWFNPAEDGVKWISVKDINNASVFILDTSETLSQESLNKFNINIVKKYTVILSFKLTVGKVAIATEDMVTNEAIAHFNIEDNTIMNSEYIYFYLKLFPYDILGSTSSIGSAINSKVVKSMPILVPDKNTINKFQKIVEPYFKQIKKLIIQNKTLREARDILLPKLINGDFLKYIL